MLSSRLTRAVAAHGGGAPGLGGGRLLPPRALSSASSLHEAPLIATKLSATSAKWAENAAVMDEHVAELRQKLALHTAGGSAKARQLHTSRGKLLARERVNALLDPGSSNVIGT